MKSVVVAVSGCDAQDSAIQAALDLVRASAGHLTCLQVTPYTAYSMEGVHGGAGMLPALIDAIVAQCREERQRLEAVLAGEGVSWDWVRCGGDAIQALASASRLADAIVVGQHPDQPGMKPLSSFVGGLVLAAQAPVIVVPPSIKGFAVAGAAMIAWNGSFEASRALRDALPLLALAESVDVVTVGDPDPDYPASAACAYLSRHGVHATMSARACDGSSTGEAILRAAAERGAAYLVMGGYGHSRVREFVFGGVTRSLLAETRLPLLLAH